MTKKEAENPAILAFSATSWTEELRPVSTAYLMLWGAPLIASYNTSCADNQVDAELGSVRLALGLACHTQSLLQQLDMEQLATPANISLRISNLQNELVPGRPLAMQLGLSRRNKHQQLRSEKGQLQVSKVHPEKNLAHSMTHKAPAKKMLTKLRVAIEAAETLALSTVQGDSLASFRSSSSLVVGMVTLEPPKMELQLRQLALIESETCFESLSRNFAASLPEESLPSLILQSLSVSNPCFERMCLTLPSKSLQDASLTLQSFSLTRANSESLPLDSWSFPIVSLTFYSLSRLRDRFPSLTLSSLSLTEGNSQSLTLQSLSLIEGNGFQRISFKEVSSATGSLKETEDILAANQAAGGAETNSFPQHCFAKAQLAEPEDGTNIFSQSFRDGILSLRICLLTLLCSFQLVCAALLLKNCSLTRSFPNQSLQPDQLVAAYCTMSFEQSPTRASQQDSFQKEKLCNKSFESNQLCRTQLGKSTLGSFQLDLVPSLSLPGFSQKAADLSLNQPASVSLTCRSA